MEEYLASTDIIDFTHPKVSEKARELAKGCKNDTEIAKQCFEFVRDGCPPTKGFLFPCVLKFA